MRLLFAFGSLAAFAACAPIPMREPPARSTVTIGARPAANLTAGCVADYREDTDYFPDKAAFRHSAQLKVEYHRNWKRVTFTPSVDTREVLRLVLVQCGTPPPKLGPRDTLVEVPVRDFATANVSLLGAAHLLGIDDRLKGVPTRNVSIPAIAGQIERGETIPIHAAQHGNGEQAAALGAELFFTFYSAYPDANIHPLLKRLGVVSAPQSDHTEPTPLGRAEWIKYVALFFNLEARANQLFDARAARYAKLRALAANVDARPLVQLGYPESRDEWSQAGGRNQLYRMIEDAGGRHAWHDNSIAGSLTYAPMETLFDRAASADVWLGNFMPGAADMATLRRDQPRLAWLRAVRDGRVYWFDAGKVGPFANSWSDQGMTEPQDALAELIAILHPELLQPPARPRFIRKIPGGPA
ncbi:MULTISPECIES: ABC transporter substrate-binding protein [unclassified Sphingopyxis]|uniref:ABC transporter substrate-binding protein n=1 Tax=unclassified Sphingopyxis TaxID=2614943 RepID=UPI0028647A47|nr:MULTISPECIES: ABC transporter substrate-binding protein [unclassified Sphingopyxis]MDR7058877.1 iron complex transport system substrate-binding protein [Sphingopyxis sp. BE235]MDR7178937.1 iron complex transport system substrate-binding protein [Sphingopyxis sp. BE249]